MSADALARRCDRKFVDAVLGDVEHDGTFSGYASLFGRVDLGKDVVERGAFSNSLLRRKASGIRMLFQHDPNEPIGVWTEIREDQRGLFVRGRRSRRFAALRCHPSLQMAAIRSCFPERQVIGATAVSSFTMRVLR